jgi:hypothetical protein
MPIIPEVLKMGIGYTIMASLFAIVMIYIWWQGVKVLTKSDWVQRVERIIKEIREEWKR